MATSTGSRILVYFQSQLFVVASSEEGATVEELEQLSRFFVAHGIQKPEELTSILRQGTTIQIQYLPEDRWVTLWGPKEIVEYNDAYHVSKYLDGAVAIGDDGGGWGYFYMNGEDGSGVYRLRFGNLFKPDAIYISKTILSIFNEGDGTSRLFGC